MEKNIDNVIEITKDVIDSMPECTNKRFLRAALWELNRVKSQCSSFEVVKNRAIEALNRKEEGLKLVCGYQATEQNPQVLKDLEKNEIEIRAEISLLRHLLDIC